MLEFPVHLEPDQCIRHALKSLLDSQPDRRLSNGISKTLKKKETVTFYRLLWESSISG
jgi:hypothetical protein